MKKILAVLMTLVLMLSCVAGFAFTSSAAAEYVEPAYYYEDALDDYGVYSKEAQLDGYGAIVSDEVVLGDNWAYEYWDPADETFKPMTAWYEKSMLEKGWVHYDWFRFYTAKSVSAYVDDAYTYCSIGYTGKKLYPGNTAGCVLSFIVPGSGNISYFASIYCASQANTAEAMSEEEYGTLITLWVNDKQVWPAVESDQLLESVEHGSSATPMEIDVPSLDVKEGDRVRLRILARGGTRANKGTILADMPEIIYNSAEVPIGNPNGAPPSAVRVSNYTIEGATVSWDEVSNVSGYNVYINGEKVNDDVITETSYVITGLESFTNYKLTVTSVNKEGKETDHSNEMSFKTKKDKNAASEKDDTSSEKVDAPVGNTKPGATNKGSFPWWIVIVGVVVVAVAAILVVVLGKKKKPAEEASAPAEAAAEVPAEETPVAEEKKDEE